MLLVARQVPFKLRWRDWRVGARGVRAGGRQAGSKMNASLREREVRWVSKGNAYRRSSSRSSSSRN